MNTAQKSLRFMVEKWLSPTPATPARVTRYGRTGSDQSRYVCVEALRPKGPVVLFFFRHGDGAWHVFPPEPARLTLGLHANAA
ncbi:hypothetical protein P0D88_03530 [Paraburkholderia sp. RL18-103-BIB-C]